MSTYSGVNAHLANCLNSVLNVKALVGRRFQPGEGSKVGAFSIIVKSLGTFGYLRYLRFKLFLAHVPRPETHLPLVRQPLSAGLQTDILYLLCSKSQNELNSILNSICCLHPPAVFQSTALRSCAVVRSADI